MHVSYHTTQYKHLGTNYLYSCAYGAHRVGAIARDDTLLSHANSSALYVT
jgi:hypothetical protein